MSEEHKPVLGDTERPQVPERMRRWLAEADKLRKAREEGKDVFAAKGGGYIIADADGPVGTIAPGAELSAQAEAADDEGAA
jgi:hypothetical protein